MRYKPVIGLEVHVELNTKSKIFCGCSAQYFGEKPNTHTCPVCLGLPGALPVPNKKAIDWCIRIGMALNCQIPLFAKFDRKNYFYPDLAKGYQISQYDEPFCVNGFIHLGGVASQHLRGDSPEPIRSEPHGRRLVEGHGSSEVSTQKTIRIRRVHMEEDTGKLLHATVDEEKISLIDFNRSGVPLVEIVTEPDFENAQEVKECLQRLQQIIRYLEVSTADMEKGQMRMEPNISLCNTSEVAGTDSSEVNLPPYKVEVKNINSFRFVEKAINFEIERQQKILESGQIPTRETRGWDEKKQITYSQRTKEEAMDYRYFPEPDIPPIHWTKYQIRQLADQIRELPQEKLERFVKQYALSKYSAEILTREKELADYFEESIHALNQLPTLNPTAGGQLSTQTVANWIINKKVNIQEILPAQLISQILSSIQTEQVDEKELQKVINQVLSENAKAVEDYKKGKKNVIMYLIGQVMRKIGKKIDTRIVKEKMEAKIK